MKNYGRVLILLSSMLLILAGCRANGSTPMPVIDTETFIRWEIRFVAEKAPALSAVDAAIREELKPKDARITALDDRTLRVDLLFPRTNDPLSIQFRLSELVRRRFGNFIQLTFASIP